MGHRSVVGSPVDIFQLISYVLQIRAPPQLNSFPIWKGDIDLSKVWQIKGIPGAVLVAPQTGSIIPGPLWHIGGSVRIATIWWMTAQIFKVSSTLEGSPLDRNRGIFEERQMADEACEDPSQGKTVPPQARQLVQALQASVSPERSLIV